MKKTVLIFILLLVLFLSPRSSAYAFLGFNAGGGSSLDCDASLRDASKGKKLAGDWSKRGVGDFTLSYNDQKKELGKKDGEYCLLQRNWISHEGIKYGEQEVKVTYFSDQKNAIAKLSELKSNELVYFKTTTDNETNYSGAIYKEKEGVYFADVIAGIPGYKVDGPIYASTVAIVGNCLIQAKDQLDGTYAYTDNREYEESWTTPLRINTEGFVNGLSKNKDLLSLCGNGNTGGNGIAEFIQNIQGKKEEPIQTKQPKSNQVGRPLKQDASGEPPSPFAIFGINPYETWLNLLSLLHLNKSVEQGAEIIVLGATQQERDQKEAARNPIVPTTDTQNSDESYIAHVDELMNRSAKLNDEVVRKAQADWDAMFEKINPETKISPFRADIVDGQVQIKYPGEEKWRDLRASDGIPPGSTIFTGMDTTTILSIKNKGAIEVLPFTEVTVSEEGLEQAGNEGKTSTDVKLKTGEVEINIEGGYYIDHFRVQTPSGVAGVRGTHFWVSYNKQTGASVVGVYKGTVAFSNEKGEQEVNLSPQGNKPGVAVAIPKTSNNYLVWVLGIIVIISAGIIVWFLKRRGQSSRGMKKRK